MTSATGPAPERPTPSSRWTQPAPQRADENLKHVHRKIDRNLKSAGPLVDNSPRFGPRPEPVVQLSGPGAGQPETSPESATGAPPDDDEDFLARAWEERMAKQWEDVTARLCRDFAPAGGADMEVVLQHIAQQRQQLDSATVRDYLPVLVEKAVRRLLDLDQAAGV